jgi:putative DNA primase/helicase
VAAIFRIQWPFNSGMPGRYFPEPVAELLRNTQLANGLQVPLEIRQVVEEYRTGMDTVSLFLSECCLYGSKMHVTVDDMYQTFAKWCEDAGRIPLSKRALGIRLKQRFSSDKIGGKRGWLGVGLKSERDDF